MTLAIVFFIGLFDTDLLLDVYIYELLQQFVQDLHHLANASLGALHDTMLKLTGQEEEMEVAELKLLRFSSGVTRIDKILNEYIRGTAQVGWFGEKTREARLRWYGHLRRKDDWYIGRRMPRIELPGKRKRGRPKRRFMGVVKEDMAGVEVTEEGGYS